MGRGVLPFCGGTTRFVFGLGYSASCYSMFLWATLQCFYGLLYSVSMGYPTDGVMA